MLNLAAEAFTWHMATLSTSGGLERTSFILTPMARVSWGVKGSLHLVRGMLPLSSDSLRRLSWCHKSAIPVPGYKHRVWGQRPGVCCHHQFLMSLE